MLIPDYYRGETGERHFMTGTIGMFIKQQTNWELLGSITCHKKILIEILS